MGASTTPLSRARSYTVNLRLPLPAATNTVPPTAVTTGLASAARAALSSLSPSTAKLPRPTAHKRTMSAVVHSTPEPASRASGALHLQYSSRDLALQKYLLLQEQHESLLQHLGELQPVATTSLGSVTSGSSPSTSPTRYSPSSASSFQRQRQHGGRSSSSRPQHAGGHRQGRGASVPPFGLETVLDERTLHQVASEEAKLFDVNEGIKRALTELLNCEAVRADRALRTWVQSRLMETERELRTGRRRRSAPGAMEP